MKSIMQEASSIEKAIKEGWVKAGKPTDFSIKIYQEPVKNFIGMTVKSAKIGIFFKEKVEVKPAQRHAPRPQKKVMREMPREMPREMQEDKIKQKPKKEIKEEQLQPKRERVFWTDDMVQFSQEWLDTALETMDKPEATYSTNALNYQIRFAFNKPLLEDSEKERQLFRSFSLLLLQALRHKLKRPLRGFKVVLTTQS